MLSLALRTEECSSDRPPSVFSLCLYHYIVQLACLSHWETVCVPGLHMTLWGLWYSSHIVGTHLHSSIVYLVVRLGFRFRVKVWLLKLRFMLSVL